MHVQVNNDAFGGVPFAFLGEWGVLNGGWVGAERGAAEPGPNGGRAVGSVGPVVGHRAFGRMLAGPAQLFIRATVVSRQERGEGHRQGCCPGFCQGRGQPRARPAHGPRSHWHLHWCPFILIEGWHDGRC